MKVLKLAAVLLGVLLALVIVATLVGTRLPRVHRAACRASFSVGPEALFATLVDVESFPAWHPGVRAARRVEPVAGRRSFEEDSSDGTVRYVVEEETPPLRLVVRIVDDGLPYGGTWTYELVPEGGRTRVTITEDGHVDPPLFRFLARFVFGHHASLEASLAALGAKLGEPVVVERVP